MKLKSLADNDFKDLSGEALKEAISKRIREKSDNLVGDMASQGTTPRQLTDLIGSLCDLTSGSGDKGTPVVLVQGYFYKLIKKWCCIIYAAPFLGVPEIIITEFR